MGASPGTFSVFGSELERDMAPELGIQRMKGISLKCFPYID